MSSLGQVLGAHPSPASRADNDDVRLELFWLQTGRELQKFIFVMRPWLVMIWDWCKPRDTMICGACLKPETLSHKCHLLVDRVQRGKVGDTPAVENSLTDMNWLILERSCIACEYQRSHTSAMVKFSPCLNEKILWAPVTNKTKNLNTYFNVVNTNDRPCFASSWAKVESVRCSKAWNLGLSEGFSSRYSFKASLVGGSTSVFLSWCTV